MYTLTLLSLYILVLGRQFPFLPKPKSSKTGKQCRSRKGKTNGKQHMVVGETGNEVDVGAVPAKKVKKGGGVCLFEAKFKQPGTKQ